MAVTTSQEYSGYVAPGGTAVRRVRLEVAAVRALIDEIDRSVSVAGPRSGWSLEVQLLEQLTALARAIERRGAAEAGAEGKYWARFIGGCNGDCRRVALTHGSFERMSQQVPMHSDIHPGIADSTFTIENSHFKGKDIHK
jgi:hypothetical protein